MVSFCIIMTTSALYAAVTLLLCLIIMIIIIIIALFRHGNKTTTAYKADGIVRIQKEFKRKLTYIYVQYLFFCEESLMRDTNLHNKDYSKTHSGSYSQMTHHTTVFQINFTQSFFKFKGPGRGGDVAPTSQIYHMHLLQVHGTFPWRTLSGMDGTHCLWYHSPHVSHWALTVSFSHGIRQMHITLTYVTFRRQHFKFLLPWALGKSSRLELISDSLR